MQITFKEIKKGTIFVVKESFYTDAVKGEELVVIDPPKPGDRMIGWEKIKNPNDSGYSFWEDFKKGTSYVSGKKSIPNTVITSTGAFSGFDIELNNFEYDEDRSELKCNDKGENVFVPLNPIITFDIEFIGSFTGGKKLKTSMITDIKRSPNFKEEVISLFKSEIKNNTKLNGGEILNTGIEETNKCNCVYSGGKINIELEVGKTKKRYNGVTKFISG